MKRRVARHVLYRIGQIFTLAIFIALDREGWPRPLGATLRRHH